MNENEQFRTSDINLASFLSAKGFQLFKIENHSKRKIFVFDNNLQLKHLTEVFYFAQENDAELMVDARKLFRSLKELKTKIYSIDYH